MHASRSHFDSQTLRSALRFTLLLACALAWSARAAVTVVSYYRLGEADPGAVNGGVITTAVDSAGANHLAVSGAPVWTNDVSAAATANTASSLSASFAGSQYGTNAVLTTATDNFGLEAWVKPAGTNGNHCIAFNGITSANGWGLYQVGDTFQALVGGVSVFGSAPVTLNGWTHVALVRASGLATFYVNGIVSGTSGAAPAVPSGRFAIATAPQSPGVETLNGCLDEVRVFTFAPGQFTIGDLLVFQTQFAPTVATLGANGIAATSVVLNGTVNPNGLATYSYFEYGTSTNYDSFTATNQLTATNAALAVNRSLTGLTFETIYHYRLVASNSLGRSYGEDRSFKTQRLPQTNVVVTLADDGPGSLREAIRNSASGDWILLATNGTIVLTSGELLTTNSLTIVGPGATNLTISGNLTSRHFNLAEGTTSRIAGLRLVAGDLPSVSCAEAGAGGAILNAGTLTLTACEISGNRAAGGGFCSGTNSPAGNGGAIRNLGTLTMVACTLADNSAGAGRGRNCHPGGRGGDGGAIHNSGILALAGCTLVNNQAGTGGFNSCLSGTKTGGGGSGGHGGAIFNEGSLTMSNCTLFGNQAGLGSQGDFVLSSQCDNFPDSAPGSGGHGGGIYNSGSLALTSCTIAGNVPGGAVLKNGQSGAAGSGGGLYSVGTASLRNTIIAGNTLISRVGVCTDMVNAFGPDIAGTVISQGHNLIGTVDGSGGLTNVINADLVGSSLALLDPLLGALQDNGGPTFTRALLPNSPAIGTGDDALTGTDQRGFPRLHAAHVDIGAYESPFPPDPSQLQAASQLGNGNVQFTFTNWPAIFFTVLASTNVALPLANWTVLGSATETPPGQYQFTDTNAPTLQQRYYRVSWP